VSEAEDVDFITADIRSESSMRRRALMITFGVLSLGAVFVLAMMVAAVFVALVVVLVVGLVGKK